MPKMRKHAPLSSKSPPNATDLNLGIPLELTMTTYAPLTKPSEKLERVPFPGPKNIKTQIAKAV